ncbi:MAG: outer membrane protein assembly factor BamA, partial [Verrucomicrobia bacterium]|nr:outer membrane protein assembly factor BamA [Verrucomicrobiota bacterium]
MNDFCSWRRFVLTSVAAAACAVGQVRAQEAPQTQQPQQTQTTPPQQNQPNQPGTQPQKAAIVRQIEIQYAGPATLSRQRILTNMRTTVGQPYSETTIEDDVRSLYSTGLVTNVRIYGEPLPDGVKVIVVVQTRVTLAAINIQGAERVKPNRIRRELNLKINAPLDEQALEQARQKVVELYQKRGFPDVDVSYKVDTNEDRGTATVTFAISEGTRAIVRHIVFIGNTVFKPSRLRKEMKTQQANPIGFITGAGRYSSVQLDDDVGKIKQLYQNNGYEDIQVTDVKVNRVNKKYVDINIYLVEGPQYHINTVTIEGLQVVTEANFRKLLKQTEGQVFSPDKLQKDIKAIEDGYGVAGYADAKVTVQTTPAGPALVDLHWKVEEGLKSYVERINISGNTRTKDKVIRRELVLAPGDVFDTVRVDISKKRLEGLQYFDRVDTYASDTLVPGRKDLNVVVQEKRTGSLNFGVGFSSNEGLIGFGELNQGNFDITNWRTLTGAGQKFRARLQIGTQEKQALISFTEPYFLDQRLAVGTELFYLDSQFYSDVYSQRDYGFTLFARKPISNFLAARLEYRLQETDIYDVTTDDPVIRAEQGNSLESRVTFGMTYDRRDNAFLTRKGIRVDFSTYISGGFLGGDVQIYGFDLAATQYFLLPFDTILTLDGEIAGVDNWGSGHDVPIYDRLFLGGANNLRGFKFQDVGPLDPSGQDVIGGNSLLRWTIEYTVPVVERVRAAVFYDAGFVNRRAWDYGFYDLNADVGAGLRLNLPIGPIRIDYGIPIQYNFHNKSTGRF